MEPYERKILTALAVLLVFLLSANLYFHFKQAVHLEVVSSLATKRGESVQKSRFVDESTAISGGEASDED